MTPKRNSLTSTYAYNLQCGFFSLVLQRSFHVKLQPTTNKLNVLFHGKKVLSHAIVYLQAVSDLWHNAKTQSIEINFLTCLLSMWPFCICDFMVLRCLRFIYSYFAPLERQEWSGRRLFVFRPYWQIRTERVFCSENFSISSNKFVKHFAKVRFILGQISINMKKKKNSFHQRDFDIPDINIFIEM